VKNIGKPCAGKPHVRFDEEGLVKLTMEWLLRHRQTKGAETDKQLLMVIESQSFTLPFFALDTFLHKTSLSQLIQCNAFLTAIPQSVLFLDTLPMFANSPRS